MRIIADPLLTLPRPLKRVIAIGVDSALCALTVWIAYCLRFSQWVPMNGQPLIAVVLSICVGIPVFAAFGLYRVVFRHAGTDALAPCAIAATVYGIIYATFITAYGFQNVPRTVGIIQPILLFVCLFGSRLIATSLLGDRYRHALRSVPQRRALIYGAGSAGRQLANAMASSAEIKILGFLDDDRTLHNSRLCRLRVYNADALDVLVEDLQITDVLLAIPSASRARKREIIEALKSTDITVRTLPGLLDLAHGVVQASDLREVTITELLQRDPVSHDTTQLLEHITGNVILVTGAGGSIGSELCRQIASMEPCTLLMVDASEFALYAIHDELASLHGDRLVPLLASVVDDGRMDAILEVWRPHMIFHAAAFKHVPLVEHNPSEGLRNNVLGTAIIAQLAIKYKVRDFVLISTDKAVRPTNIMGASKRLAELVVQAQSAIVDPQETCFSMVRFGNVLGSSGSVVPLFTRQIHAGGPITITHPDITRYFMTISEAVTLVLHAAAMAKGGEVFVLDMGEPMRIYDMALQMIQLSGLTPRDELHPDGDIEVRITGLRPGEKLYEELLIGDNPSPTQHPRIMKATEHAIAWSDLSPRLDDLHRLIADGDVVEMRRLLITLVVEFRPSSDVVDWVETQRRKRPDSPHLAAGAPTLRLVSGAAASRDTQLGAGG